MSDHSHSAPVAQLPTSFLGYLKSTGPGLVVVLTWLGAGDIVDRGGAGANYGYSLMWVLVLAVVMRFLFVSLIAKYQLCNFRGEGVLDGLARLHPGYAPLLFVAAIVMGHVYGSYMTVGVGEACRNVTGLGEVWMWALFWNGLALVLVTRPQYQVIETLFKIFWPCYLYRCWGQRCGWGPSRQRSYKAFIVSKCRNKPDNLIRSWWERRCWEPLADR